MERATNGRGAAGEPSKLRVVGVHSQRGGSGKSTLAANLAYLAARSGRAVAVVDADLQAPALHALFGVGPNRVLHSLSGFVKGECELREVPIDLSRELGLDGALYLLPASADLQATTSILFDGYDVGRLREHLLQVAGALELDLLIVDTHHGFNRESLLSLATFDTVLVVLRPDGHDRQGAATFVQIASKLGSAATLLVPNMVGDGDRRTVARYEKELGAPVAGVLPWCGELSEPGCAGPFAARRPEHRFVAKLEGILERATAVEAGAGGRP